MRFARIGRAENGFQNGHGTQQVVWRMSSGMSLGTTLGLINVRVDEISMLILDFELFKPGTVARQRLVIAGQIQTQLAAQWRKAHYVKLY